ncbi:MAG: cell division protein FtsQ/DivIB [Gaiellaceae bacterium]
MVRRPHLALVPANGLRPRLRAPSARTLGIAGAVLGVLGLLYLAARETPLFAVREVDVTGAPPAVRKAVLETAAPFLGESLVALDRDELRRSLEALPTVRSLRIDRAFPHTLRIAVIPERPLAVLRRGRSGWLVSERGRVMQELQVPRAAARPRVWIGQGTHVESGELVDNQGVRVALRVLRRVPDGFPMRIRAVWAAEGAVTLVLVGDAELRVGTRDALALKLHVAGRVLRTLTPQERRELAYLDVTVPERPVGGTKSQVST